MECESCICSRCFGGFLFVFIFCFLFMCDFFQIYFFFISFCSEFVYFFFVLFVIGFDHYTEFRVQNCLFFSLTF